MIAVQISASESATPRRRTTISLVLCAVLSILMSLAFSLYRGEFRTRFTEARLDRTTDFVPFAFHRIQGNGDDIHPLFSYYVQRNNSIGPVLVLGLVRAGFSFETAANIGVVVFRSFFGIALSWLIIAATGKRSLGVLGVFSAFCLQRNTLAYGYLPDLAISGLLSVNLFLVACSLYLLRYRWAAIAFWIFQVWAHPITFICWSPVFLGLLLAPRLKRSASATPWKFYLGLLVFGPGVVGVLTGLAESAELLPFAGNEAYWALVQTRASHSVFFFGPKYAVPLEYLSQVVALFLFVRFLKTNDTLLRTLNMLVACLGMGIGLMYAVAVETQFSAVATICGSLRFECVMYLLVIGNVFYVVFYPGPDRAKTCVYSACFGVMLLLPSLKPLLWAWAWGLGLVAIAADERRRRRYAVAAFLGSVIVLGYLVAVPSHKTWILEKMADAAVCGKTLVWLVVAFAVSTRINSVDRRLLYAVACTAILLVPSPTWFLRPTTLVREVEAIVRAQPESSPHKQACDWINANIPPGTPVLTSPRLYLHFVTHVRTSINNEITALFIYAPESADGIADEIKDVYGIDVVALKRQHKRLYIGPDDWFRARRKVLATTSSDQTVFRYVAEVSSFAPDRDGTIVFENEYIRVYCFSGPSGFLMGGESGE